VFKVIRKERSKQLTHLEVMGDYWRLLDSAGLLLSILKFYS